MEVRELADEAATRDMGAWLASRLAVGDVLLLSGPLGAGKTTLVRGLAAALGYAGSLRSPTFNLVQELPTEPPVVHVDLYRVESPAGLGLEDALDRAILVIEWPDRAAGWLDPDACWRVALEFSGEGRRARVQSPRS